MKRLLAVGVLLLSAGLLLAGGGSEAAAPEGAYYPKEMVLRAGSVGGPWVPTMTMIADLMMQQFPGLNCVVQPGGGLENIRVIEEGVDSDFGLCHQPLYWEAKKGTLDAGKNYPKISALLNITASTQQMAVRADSNIRSFYDLKDKRIGPGKKGTGGEITAMRVLEEYGITYDAVRSAGGSVSFVDSNEQGIALKDRSVDFVNLSGNLPHAVLQDVETTAAIRLLDIEPAVLKKINEKYPFYVAAEVPAGTFKGMKEPVTALLNIATLIVNDSLSDQFVYEVTKLLMEKAPEIKAALPFVDRLTPDRAIQGLTPELMHPAAVRYFKEIGVLK